MSEAVLLALIAAAASTAASVAAVYIAWRSHQRQLSHIVELTNGHHSAAKDEIAALKRKIVALERRLIRRVTSEAPP